MLEIYQKSNQSNVRMTQHAATIAIRIIKNCAKHEKYLKKHLISSGDRKYLTRRSVCKAICVQYICVSKTIKNLIKYVCVTCVFKRS